MFRNLRKKTKKNLIEKKNLIFISSCPSFVFALYILMSSNLLIILKKELHIRVDLHEAP